MLSLLLLCVIVVYIAAIIWAPFPYWPSYLILWKAIFRFPGPWRMKLRQAFFLIKAGISAPIWTIFWYLDEIFYPCYRQRDIQPVFIIGQPRCGTTFLHRTLATDDHTFFAVRHIEWRYPFITVQKLIKVFGLDRNLSNVSYWPNTESGQMAAKMHPNTLADWEEEGIFFEEKFLHHFFIFLRFPYPELLPYLDSFPELPERSQQKMLRAYRKTLQKVQYLRGHQPRIYLSKEVTSHKRIPALLKLFPSARFVVIVRPSRDFMSSLRALMRMSTMSKTDVDPCLNEEWHAAFIRRMREDSLRLVSLCMGIIPADKLIRISANYFMANPGAAVHSIYRALGLAMHDKFATYLSQVETHQKARARGYDYDDVAPKGFDDYDAFVRDIDECSNTELQAASVPVPKHFVS